MVMQKGHFVFVGLLCAIAVGVWILHVVSERQSRATQQAWQDFAWRNGLGYAAETDSQRLARMSGTLRGRAFAMWEVSIVTANADSNTIVTRVTLRPHGLPDGFALYERPGSGAGEAMLSGALNIAARLGAGMAPEVATGDTAFDEQWVTHGSDPDATRIWMASVDRRNSLLEFIAQPGFELQRDGIGWEGSTPADLDAIEQVVGTLEHYAQRLESP